MTSLGELPRRKLRENTKFILIEVHARDETLLRAGSRQWDFLSQFEYWRRNRKDVPST